MRRTDPQTVTYLLAFLVVYLIIFIILVFVLRSFMIDELRDEGERLGKRADLLAADLVLRTEQEQRIIATLLEERGALDFEDAYARIQARIAELREERQGIDARVGLERELRIVATEERDAVIAQEQALELVIVRLAERLSGCQRSLEQCTLC